MKEANELKKFLQHEFMPLLEQIPIDTKPQWGIMNVWQMTEHLAWPFKASNGNFKMPITTPEDKLERVRAIGLLSDRPIQRLFNNPILTDKYKVIRNATIEASRTELKADIDAFITHFENGDPSLTEIHNLFGPLTFHEWLWFHYKHCKHHLEQFGVLID